MNNFRIGNVLSTIILGLGLGLGGCQGKGGFGDLGFLNTDAVTNPGTTAKHPDLALGSEEPGVVSGLFVTPAAMRSAPTTARVNMNPGHEKALAQKYDLTDRNAMSGFYDPTAASKMAEAAKVAVTIDGLSGQQRTDAANKMYGLRKEAVQLEAARIAAVKKEVDTLVANRRSVAASGEQQVFANEGNDKVLERYEAWQRLVDSQHAIFAQQNAPTGLEMVIEFNLATIAARLNNGENIPQFKIAPSALAQK
jgi:hypothetical protein